MLIYEYKLDGKKQQYAAIDEAIHIVQFIRNKCLRKWMDGHGISRNDLQCYCAALAREYAFAACLNSQARQVSADRAWAAISRFYENCRNKKPGKKGYPQFQHDNRSVEYKQTGWRIKPDGKHLTFTDHCGIGRLRLVGNKKQAVETFPVNQVKRVRIVKRADGYYCQFAVQAERKVAHVSTGKPVGIDVGLKVYYRQEISFRAYSHLSYLWPGPGSRRECRKKHLARWTPHIPSYGFCRYRGAHGNLRAVGKRFWTARLYPVPSQGEDGQADWMKEEPPAL